MKHTLAITAHHEAGHAVAAFFRGVRIKHVTILADQGSAGHVRFLGRPGRGVAQMHKRGVVALAGEAAQRRFSPCSVRRHHGAGDRGAVLAFALDCTGSTEQAELLARLWEVQARDLVELRWPSVQRVAAALLERETLDAGEVLRLAHPTGAAL